MNEFFSDKELACKCCGEVVMQDEFMQKLNLLRAEYAKPMIVTSGYRCEKHNREIGGGAAHPRGQAVDVRVNGSDAWFLVRLALNLGFAGIGINIPNGKGGDGFIHLDTCADLGGRPRIWTY
jgi:uncharacterized protein YcbK (DUF882 family)